MDTSKIQIGDIVRTSDGSSCKVTDISRLPKFVGVAGSYDKHPVIWWPAACVSPRKTAERSALLAKNEADSRAILLTPVPPPLPVPRPRTLAITTEPVAVDNTVNEEVESA